jgi:chromate reductase
MALRLLGLGGSLRRGSWNRGLLEEAARIASTVGAELDLGQLPAIGALPLYSQDVGERDGVPAVATELKERLAASAGLLIATPEYNWGIPGFLKNAIDWASRPPGDIPRVFGDLPVAMVGAGGFSGTRNAQTAWVAVFRYLKMRPWFGRTLFVDRSWERFDEHGVLTDESTRDQLRAVVVEFAAHCTDVPRRRSA